MRITIRMAKPEDYPFIFSHWLNSYRSAPQNRPIRNEIYFTQHHEVIENLLADDSVITVLAINTDNPSQIFGFACGTHMDGVCVLHYVFVKELFRRLGIATALVKAIRKEAREDLILHTHHTRILVKVLKNKEGWLYHPYLLWRHRK